MTWFKLFAVLVSGTGMGFLLTVISYEIRESMRKGGLGWPMLLIALIGSFLSVILLLKPSLGWTILIVYGLAYLGLSLWAELTIDKYRFGFVPMGFMEHIKYVYKTYVMDKDDSKIFRLDLEVFLITMCITTIIYVLLSFYLVI